MYKRRAAGCGTDIACGGNSEEGREGGIEGGADLTVEGTLTGERETRKFKTAPGH